MKRRDNKSINSYLGYLLKQCYLLINETVSYIGQIIDVCLIVLYVSSCILISHSFNQIA